MKEKNVGKIIMEYDRNITDSVNNFMAHLITEITVLCLFTIEQSKDIHSLYIQVFYLFPHIVKVRKITSRQCVQSLVR
jgi:hypothetical protein